MLTYLLSDLLHLLSEFQHIIPYSQLVFAGLVLIGFGDDGKFDGKCCPVCGTASSSKGISAQLRQNQY